MNEKKLMTYDGEDLPAGMAEDLIDPEPKLLGKILTCDNCRQWFHAPEGVNSCECRYCNNGIAS